MNFWLKHSDKDKFRLPVSPESFEISVAHKNTPVTITSRGEINLLGKTGLRSVSLSCFFPAKDYNFSSSDREDPDYYIEKLEKWRKKNTVIRFIIPNTINMLCSIEGLTWGQRDCTKDVYYTISLKEYRKLSTKERTVKDIKATTHKIKKDDTLRKIAKKYYGKDGATYRNKIYNANKNIIKSKTNLPKGKTIKIPALEVVFWE